jgi:hypothetical protein
MKIEIRLCTNEKESSLGFPLALFISHLGKRKRKNLSFCKESHFIQDGNMISHRHPDFDILAPILMDLKIKARSLILKGAADVEKVFDELFGIDTAELLFFDFGKKLIDDMKQMAVNLGEANNLTAQNKQLGNLRVYENVLAQFLPHGSDVTLQGLNYEILFRFRNYQIGIGNSKSTVHLYLRTLRAIYNKGIMEHQLQNKKPFEGVFANLKQRSFDNKKKYLDKEVMRKLENLDLKSEKQKYLDLFLLQFYFGGCDLVDLYFLKKNQIKRNRVSFVRTKTNTGTRIDLKIHPKADLLLQKYTDSGEWVFPWGKDKASYENFRRTYQRGLIYIQEKNDVSVFPDGGNMGVKVARHTFANMAKNLMIEPDVIRELMGHERDDVDNYYKDKYPEAVRDDALFKIII